ncbi:hypothetical protein M8542_36040 [Amycolatopsis sp. OK19-0408]|uniref:Uncharacterized protein n=1 Tax=Amycolatopsis iheyensis TaxID=2945988 RepID=A0A9X2NK49_9PSEU|nr:hypothetical protein [Amycolatopsis iheyensis]MCR6488255.1 hypothetical protein [Amycolatopsis iheyensis]
MAWLLRERATGHEWRVGNSDLAWDIGGYDTARFELHVLDKAAAGTPEVRPIESQDKGRAG